LLARRPSRAPDYQKESAVLLRLADAMAAQPDKILQALCDEVIEVFSAGSAGVSLFASEDPDADFWWPAISGAWAPFIGGGMPRDQSPCGVVVKLDTFLIYHDVEKQFPAAAAASPRMEELMLAPFHQEGRPVGTIWVINHEPGKPFDAEDRRMLASLTRFASAAFLTIKTAKIAQDAKSRLALTLSSTPILGLWDWDVARDLVTADAKFADLYGVDPIEAAAGVAIGAFVGGIHPDDRSRVEAEIAASLATGAPFASEYRVRPTSGGLVHLLARGAPELDDYGHVVRLPGVVIDITERRRVEEALRASEAQLLGLAQALPNQVWTAQADGRLDWLNDSVMAYSGLPDEVLKGDGWTTIVHPDDLAQAATAWASALASGQHYQTEFRLRRADGVYRWHLARAVPSRNAAAVIDRWIGTSTDIDDQKALAERLAREVEDRTQALQDSEDFARLALSAVGGIGVWTYDVATNRFVCDASISQIYGLDPEAGASGLSPADFLANVHPDDRAALSKTLAEGLRRPGDLELEYRIRHPDGAVNWVMSRGHTYFENGEAVRRTGVGIDTTRTRQLEEQLRQSQKMEAVGQLTGGIAHDFNNMLTGISGSLDLIRLRMAAGRSDGIERFMDAAMSSTQRAAALTHRLLAFARRQSLDTRSQDLARLIAGMDDLLRRTLGERVRMDTRVEGGLWLAMTDANQFESALLNLAINARDAMPDGGDLTVSASNLHLDAVAAKAKGDVAPGDYVVVSVADTGSGMPADVLAQVFDPFFTTKPLGQGTGLGLSMIYGFARQSGGHIHIDSAPGRGTSVELYLRRAFKPEDREETQVPVDAPRGAGESVLVVEDDDTVRLLITEVLQELGYRYLEAPDAQAALDIVASDAEIDLLITDVGLPVMNGRQLAEIAREHRPNLKVLFVSGYAENAVLRSEFLAPGMEMMTKPFAMEALASRVRDLIGQRS
jgi:PAS domain S-box-containing protein